MPTPEFTRLIKHSPDHFRSRQFSAWRASTGPIAGPLANRGKQSRQSVQSFYSFANRPQWGLGRIAAVTGSSLPSFQEQMSQDKTALTSRPAPPVRSYTPGLPDKSNDFLNEQISKQQKSNFHSTSLNKSVTMVAQSVNKTALHPSGVEYVPSHH